jgi:hypothetical protein
MGSNLAPLDNEEIDWDVETQVESPDHKFDRLFRQAINSMVEDRCKLLEQQIDLAWAYADINHEAFKAQKNLEARRDGFHSVDDWDRLQAVLVAARKMKEKEEV